MLDTTKELFGYLVNFKYSKNSLWWLTSNEEITYTPIVGIIHMKSYDGINAVSFILFNISLAIAKL